MGYCQARIASSAELESRLDALGHGVGARVLELASLRERPLRRETSVIGILQFVSGPVWSMLFGRPADALERSTDAAHGALAFMIREEEPLATHFVCMPRELARTNVAAFTAGLVRGLLDAAGFPADAVQAVTVPAAPGAAQMRDGVVYLIRFSEQVAAREA